MSNEPQVSRTGEKVNRAVPAHLGKFAAKFRELDRKRELQIIGLNAREGQPDKAPAGGNAARARENALAGHLLKPDLDQALSFLQAHYGDALGLLTAIPPDGDTRTITLEPGKIGLARQQIERWQKEGRNVYYHANPPRKPLSDKAQKGDIGAAVCLHVDLDARKGLDWKDAQAVESELASLRRRIEGLSCPPPTMLIFSGGGFQALWKLRTPVIFQETEKTLDPKTRKTRYRKAEVDAITSEVETVNKALAQVLGADVGCSDVSRLLRVPGTINYPNAKKRTVGRVPVMAGLVEHHHERVYELSDFAALTKAAPATSTATAEGQAKPRMSRDELLARLPKYILDDIQAGGTDRSAQTHKVIWELSAQGCNQAEIELVIEGTPCVVKYDGRLTAEIERSYGKWLEGDRQLAKDAIFKPGKWVDLSTLEEATKALEGFEQELEKDRKQASRVFEPEMMRGLAALRLLNPVEFQRLDAIIRDRKNGLRNKDYNKALEESANEFKEQEKDTEHWLASVNKNFAFVVISGKSVIIHETKNEVDFWAVNAFEDYFANQFVSYGDGTLSKGKAWFKHPKRRQYERADVRPEGAPPEVFNLWRGLAVEPCEQGSSERFKEHLLGNVCRGNQAEYDWLFSWMADMVQNPHRKPGTSVILRSDEEGTGKTIVGRVLGQIIGRSHYVLIDKENHVLGQFNKIIQAKLLIQLEEAIWAGDKKAESAFKNLITADTQMIEPKGIDAFPVNSVVRVLITSNKTWVVPAGLGARRFAVFEVGKKHAHDRPYFAEIIEELENGGYGRFLWELLNHDLSKIDVAVVPQTEGLVRQKIQSLEVFERWWFNQLRTGALWKDGQVSEVETHRLQNSYKDFEKEQKGCYRPLLEEEIGSKLKELAPNMERKRYRSPGNQNIRAYKYVLPSLEECRRVFKEKLGPSWEWDDEED